MFLREKRANLKMLLEKMHKIAGIFVAYKQLKPPVKVALICSFYFEQSGLSTFYS